MIELKINGDLAQYIDTEELQMRAEEEVKYAVRDWVSKALREDDIIKKDISKYILDKATNMPFELSGELKENLLHETKDVIQNYSDWDIKYALKLDEKLNEEFIKREDEFRGIISGVLEDYMKNYIIPEYVVNNIMIDIIKEKIIARQNELKLDEVVDNFIRCGLERLMY